MAHVLMPNWHPKNNQKGTVLIWMIVWLAGMAAIYYWCVLKHIPAIEQRIQTNAQTALSNDGHESINVSVSDRIATLSGEVSSEAERASIVDTVSAAAGVRSVNDGLTILAQRDTDQDKPDANTPKVAVAETPTATVSADNDNNIVAKAVIPATKQAEETSTTDTSNEAQDSAANTPDETPTEPDASSDSSDQQVATQDTSESVSAAIAENAIEPAAQPDNETDNPTTSEIANATNNDIQVAVADIAAGAKTSVEADAADIEAKANERIKAALAIQEQEQTSSQQEQVEQAETVTMQMQPPTLNLQVDGNSLTITGDLSENDDALDLIESAMSAFGTPIVVNKIQTHKDRSPAPWLQELTGFLPAMQGIKNAGVRINQQQLVLSGDAKSEPAHDEVINQALANLSMLSLVERMRVTPEQEAAPAPKAEVTVAKETAVTESDTQSMAAKTPSSGTLEDFLVEYNELESTKILFDPGSNKLTEDSIETVIQIATILIRHPNIKIGIDGHTDNSGQSDANLRLSQERSNAVRDTLIDQGVDVERINAYGFGDGVPIADNSTPEGRRLNRRIEFNFKLDQSR